MRKFTLFIASLFIAIGAMAQTVVTTINTDRAYTLECRSGYAHSTARFIGVDGNGAVTGQSATATYITFEEATGGYYMKIGDLYINGETNGSAITTDAEAKTVWVLNAPSHTANVVTFSSNGNDYYLNNNLTSAPYLKTNSHSGGPGKDNACSLWQMCEYNLENIVDVTYNYMFNGEQVGSATVTQEIGSDYAAPAIDYVTFAYPEGNITAETTTVEVTCTQNLPFTVSTSYSNANWYYMSIRSGSKWVVRSDAAPYTNSTTKSTTDNGLWAFIGNVFDGIQVINKGAGEGYTLGIDGTATASDVYMKEGNTAWVIEQGNGGFTLRQSTDGSVYIHDYSSKLQIWNTTAAATDAGTALQVHDATDNTEAVAALQAAIDAANAMNDYIGTGVGKYTYTGEGTFAAAVAEYQTYVDAIESTSTPTPAEVEAKTTELNTLVTSLTLNMPEKGKYYRIKGYDTENYLLSDEYSDTRLAMGSGELASAIFYYGEDGSLLSYANGRYLPQAVSGGDWTCLEIGVAGPAATFGPGSSIGAYGFYVGDANNRAYFSGRKTYVDAGGTIGSSTGYDWYLEEVTTLPVTITAAKYATLYAPVALEIPSSVTAYTASISGDYAILTEISGVIPAGTGVVLAGEANTYNFTITSTTATATSDLQGSAATTYNTEAGTYYALAIVDNVVGFYKDAFNNSRFQNNSHKAYLYVPTDEANAIASYSFSFDWGGTTGIENIEDAVEENATKAIYDITGRQIKAITVPGIYIINGKKTFVK